MTNPHFEPLVRRHGLGFLPLGTVAEYEASLHDPDLWDARKAFSVVARRGILPALGPVYDAIAASAPERTVVVGSALCLGARIAQEKLSFRLATVHLQPVLLRSAYDPGVFPGLGVMRVLPPSLRRLLFRFVDAVAIDRLLAREVDAFRASLGLPRVRSFLGRWIHSPALVLGLFPAWFAAPQRDWPSRTRLAGFVGYDGGAGQPLAPELERFLAAGEPPVVVTAGSAMVHAGPFFHAAVEALGAGHRRALLVTTERAQLPADLPASMLHASHAPFATLLPRAAALIHHGGIGTLAQALGAGIPQLVLPLAHDQFDNGARVERLGAGRSAPRARHDPRRLAAEVDALLATPAAAHRARELQAQVGFEASLARACDALEELAA
jgi:rhamnosyltransferase subunit B